MRENSRSRENLGPDPEQMAIAALLYISGDAELMSRFLEMTGLDPSRLRAAAADPRFLLAILDFLMSDDITLIGFAAAEGLKPETVTHAHHLLRRAIDPAHAQE